MLSKRSIEISNAKNDQTQVRSQKCTMATVSVVWGQHPHFPEAGGWEMGSNAASRWKLGGLKIVFFCKNNLKPILMKINAFKTCRRN